MFKPLTKVCNLSAHTSMLESIMPLSVKLTEPAVSEAVILTAS